MTDTGTNTVSLPVDQTYNKFNIEYCFSDNCNNRFLMPPNKAQKNNFNFSTITLIYLTILIKFLF